MVSFFSLALLTYAVMPRYFPSFTTWSNKYNRTYTPTERDYRETVYTQNLAKIAAHPTLNVDTYTDLTWKEYVALYSNLTNTSVY